MGTGVRKVEPPALHKKLIQTIGNMLSDHACWTRTMKQGIERADVKRHQKAEEKLALHKNSSILFTEEKQNLYKWKIIHGIVIIKPKLNPILISPPM